MHSDFIIARRRVLIDGQIVGALAQGIGQALLEHVVYGEGGELLTAEKIWSAIHDSSARIGRGRAS